MNHLLAVIWASKIIAMATITISIATAEPHIPDATIISNYTQPITDNVLWPFERGTSYLILGLKIVLDYICLPFQYIVDSFLLSTEFLAIIPISATTFVVNFVDTALRLPIAFVRNFINGVIEGVVCFPANGIIMLAKILIHAPLNFIGIDINPYIVYYIVSSHILVATALQSVVSFVFNSIMFIAVDIAVQSVIKTVLELPIWTVFYLVRFPFELIGISLQITSSALKIFTSRLLLIFCSLLRFIIYVITYAVIFICYWSLDIFILAMTVVIGISAWLVLAAIFALIYHSVKFLRGKQTVWSVIQKVTERYQFVCRRYPNVRHCLEALLEMFPKELWYMFIDRFKPRRTTFGEEEEVLCEICYEDKKLRTLLPCGHSNICMSCIGEIQRRTNTCPFCRALISSFY